MNLASMLSLCLIPSCLIKILELYISRCTFQFMYVYVLLYIRVREKGKITWYVLKYKRIDCFLKKLGKLNRLFNVFYVFILYVIFFLYYIICHLIGQINYF